MANQSNNSSGGGIGFCGCLFLIFLTLKLVGVIDWSWWWVFAPFWVPVAAALAFVVFCVLMACITGQIRK